MQPAHDSFKNAAGTAAGCTILALSPLAIAGRVRALFDNSAACNQMASRDGPGDETPSCRRACGIFRSGRSRGFSGLSRLALKQSQGGSPWRRS
jgi:hypothetical protein